MFFFNCQYFLQKDGINNTNTANNSNLPKIIAILKIHLEKSDNSEKFPFGPIISPKPGPTFDIDVAAADIDGDGDMDVIGTAYTGDKVSWFVNDGSPDGANWVAYSIGTPNGPISLVIVDFDYDGDLDVLCAARVGDKIKLYTNDGTPDAGWSATNIATNVDEVSDIFVVDLDFDGYLDVVAAIEKDDEINWYDTAAIPEFPNILMPVLSVLAIMAFRRRKTL